MTLKEFDSKSERLGYWIFYFDRRWSVTVIKTVHPDCNRPVATVFMNRRNEFMIDDHLKHEELELIRELAKTPINQR